MVMGACPGQIPISCVPPTIMVTATIVRACRFIKKSFFLATTEGSLRGASLNGFKKADPLVIDAKYDLTLTERSRKQSISKFLSSMYIIRGLAPGG